jgi:transposase
MPSREWGHFLWHSFAGKAREQTRMFPVSLDELIPADHMCRVVEAFVGGWEMGKLGLVR